MMKTPAISLARTGQIRLLAQSRPGATDTERQVIGGLMLATVMLEGRILAEHPLDDLRLLFGQGFAKVCDQTWFVADREARRRVA